MVERKWDRKMLAHIFGLKQLKFEDYVIMPLTSERTETYMWLPGELFGASEPLSKRNEQLGPAEKS